MDVPTILLLVACVMFFVAGLRKVVFNPEPEIDFMNIGFAFVVLSWIASTL